MATYLPPFLHLQKKLNYQHCYFPWYFQFREIPLFKINNTRKSFIFVHVSTNCFHCVKFFFFFLFFSFCKLLTFECLQPKNLQVEVTPPQVKNLQKRNCFTQFNNLYLKGWQYTQTTLKYYNLCVRQNVLIQEHVLACNKEAGDYKAMKSQVS